MSTGAPSAGAAEAGELGRPRLHLRRTDSTNERARALALAGAPHGTLVTASEQTAGRGRQGRSWMAPAGSSLLASLLLRPPPVLLPLIAAVAVCDVAGEQALIKWPNDVVVAGAGGLAKLAGILVEGRPQEGWAVLGIGLNVAVEVRTLPQELRASAASMGRPRAEVEPLLEQLLQALSRRLGEPAETVLQAWRSRDALRGRSITWGSPGARAPAPGAPAPAGGAPLRYGRAGGIDGEGRLIVVLPDGGRTALGSGEVHLQGIG